MNGNVIYFSVNNWFCGEDYPPTENFKKWLGSDLNQTFRNDEWTKENKLCIYCGLIDMSMNYTIAAPRKWVEENCPELLTDDEFTYITVISKGNEKGEWVQEKQEHKKKYSDFVDKPDEYGDVIDHRFGWPYLEYKPENFGVHWYHDSSWDEEYEDDDEEEEND